MDKEEIWEEIRSNWTLMEDKNTSDLRFVRLSERNMELLKLVRELEENEREKGLGK